MRDDIAVRILILGGTKFLGRAIAEVAVARGHALTLFNRGQTNPELFPEVEKLRGDREGDLAQLRGHVWDVVIDTSGNVPGVVSSSAALLSQAAGYYLFVSTRSVYAPPYRPGFDESALTVDPDNGSSKDPGQRYGALKLMCERIVADIFPDAHAVIRPGLIVGPHDPSGRFTYWPLRIASGGAVLAPAPPERQVQFIDVRDLGDWIMRLAEERTNGTYNAAGPNPATNFGQLLDACRGVARSDAEIVWVDEPFLLERGVVPWMELPLWLPGQNAAYQQGDVSKALAAGLRLRPVVETLRDTLEWAYQAGADLITPGEFHDAGMAPARELELLSSWADLRTKLPN
jgi:2'-hydroxyisoflavone reductase